MSRTAFGVFLMVIGSSIMNLGFCYQKKGVSSYAKTQRAHPEYSRARVLLTNPVWAVGIVLNIVGVLLAMLAMGLAPYTLVAPMRATGFFALALFSRIILGERLSRLEGFGLLLMAVSTALLGVMGVGRSTLVSVEQFNEKFFSPAPCALTATLLLAASSLWAVAARRGYPYAGCVFGFWGGVTSAVGMIYSKGLALALMDGLGKLLFTPRGIITLLLSQFGILTLIGSQIGYKYARAVAMVPPINVLGLVIPVIYGAAFLGEWQLLPRHERLIQAALLLTLLLAVVLLSGLGEKADSGQDQIPSTANMRRPSLRSEDK